MLIGFISSCSLCRRRKVRCNRETPCSNCVRCRNEACVYETHPSQSPLQHLGPGQGSRGLLAIDRAPSSSRESTLSNFLSNTLVASSSASAPALASPASAQDVEGMAGRIKQLEEQLSKAQRLTQSLASTPNSNIETTTSSLGGTFHLHRESRALGLSQVITRSVTHKTRMFGQSHWINPLFTFVSSRHISKAMGQINMTKQP